MTRRDNIKVPGSTEECSSRTMLTRHGLRATLLAGTALVGVALAQPAAAQTTEWLGLSTDWFDAANWDNGVPLPAGSIARITSDNPGGAGAQITVPGAEAQTLRITGLGDGGLLTISGGGTLESHTTDIGDAANESGAVLVTGAASTWTNSADLYVGSFGANASGTLTVQDGGAVSANVGWVGFFSGTTGAVMVTGQDSTLTILGGLRIGESGNGTLTVEDGGEVISSGGDIGRHADSHGQVTVTGANSIWTSSAEVNVGRSSEGRLEVTDGGAFETTPFINVNVGGTGGTTGTGFVTVDGAGSQITTNELWIGRSGGAGEVSVLNGGKITLNASLQAALPGGGTATIVVDGAGSELTTVQGSFIGQGGNADLTISGGGKLVSGAGADVGAGGGQGTVIVTGQDSEWSSGSALRLGLSGNAVLTIADNGLVSVGAGNSIRLATNMAGSGTLNVGAAAGDPAAAAGTLNADTVEFSEGAATLLFNHTALAADNYEFTADLESTGAGTHAINHQAGVTNYTGDGSAFSGTTTVSGGTLLVNNALGGTTVITGGVLGGAGTVGALTMNGGVLAPGNSIGTLNVASATFNPGSVFQVELNDGGFVAGVNNDLLNATGAVTINGGTIHVTPVNGTDDGSTYTPGTYTIITAAGGVSGTFDAITDDFAFLSFTSAYDANNAYLISSLVSPGFCLSGFTATQCAVGAGVSSLGAGNALFDALLGLSNADAPIALNQLSGEAHASGQTALINSGSRLRTIIGNRIDAVFNNQRPTAAFMSFASKGSPADQLVADRYGAWGHVHGSWGRTASTTNTAAMRHDDAGFMLGADSRFGEAWYGGVFSGYSRSNFKVSGRGSSGSSDNYHLGLYGGVEFGAFHLNMGAAHTWHRIGTTRHITLPVRERLSASYNARTMQIFGEAAYRMEAGAARFEPFASLAHVNLRTDGFTETGGTAALTSFGRSTATTFSTLGLRASTQFQMGDMTATARGMIGWRHAFGDTTPASRVAFAGGNSFLVSGAPIAKNAAVMEFGLDMQVGTRATLGLSYDGQLASGSNEHGARARLRVSF